MRTRSAIRPTLRQPCMALKKVVQAQADDRKRQVPGDPKISEDLTGRIFHVRARLSSGYRRGCDVLRRRLALRRSPSSPARPSRTRISCWTRRTATGSPPSPRCPTSRATSGIVILPDVRGLYRFYEELALRFAERGYAAIAFDYFGRTAGVAKRDDDFEYMPHVQAVKPAEIQADVAAVVAWLREQGASTDLHRRLLHGRSPLVAVRRRRPRPRGRRRLLRAHGRRGRRLTRADPARRGDGVPDPRPAGGRRREHHGRGQRRLRGGACAKPAFRTSSSRTRARRTASSTASRRSSRTRRTTPGSASSSSSPRTPRRPVLQSPGRARSRMAAPASMR